MPYGTLPQVTLQDGSTVNGFTVHIPSPEKTAVCRLPTNKEILTYLQKEADKENKRLNTPQGTNELELFNLMRLDKDGVAFDEYEAYYVVAEVIMLRALPIDSQKEGESFTVTLETGFGLTTHVFRMITMKELAMYRKALGTGIDWYSNPDIELYDKCIKRVEGYAEDTAPVDVPPHHKTRALIPLLRFYSTFDPLLPN